LRKEGEELARSELPRRWVDLIHHLDEEEWKRSQRSQTQAQRREPEQRWCGVRPLARAGRVRATWLRLPV